MIKTAATLILVAAGWSLAAGPFPPLEQFPEWPYVPAPTPEEIAHWEREDASNRVADAAYHDAVSEVLAQMATAAPTNWQSRLQAAAALKEHAKALKKVKSAAATNTPSKAAVEIYEKAKEAKP